VGAYDEAKAAVEALWAEEIGEAERAVDAADGRIRAAERRVRELRAEIAEAGRGITAARAEMGGMGERITQARLEGDDGEVLAIQGRHAELGSLVEGLEERAARAHNALAELCGGDDPAAYLANVRDEARAEAEAARYDAEWRCRREFEEVREVLEGRRAAAAGSRHPAERINHEHLLATGGRPDAKPPHVRRAERAEERRRFEENRRTVEFSISPTKKVSIRTRSPRSSC